jgi:hypothetical protein
MRSAAGMVAAVLVLGVLLWRFVPRPDEHTIRWATIDHVERAQTSTIHFVANSFPHECRDPDPHRIGFVAHAPAEEAREWHAGMSGELRVRVQPSGCSVITFAP